MSDIACPVCGDAFTGEKGVRDHTWDAHDACHHCGTTVEDRDALYSHWLEDHPDALAEADRKRAENRVGERTVCPVCEERFGGVDAVRSHAWDAHQACHHCGAAFDDREAIAAHWLGSHGAELTRSTRDRAQDEVGDLSFGQRLSHQGPVDAVTGTSVSRRAVVGAGALGAVGLLGGAAATGQFGGFGGSETTLADHPAGQALDGQPTLGPAPSEAEGTIVAFEDPSCTSCARFESQTFPRLKSELIDPGRVSFVFRTIPVVYAWGEPASLALEAVHAREPSAFWGLKDFYYENQRDLGSDNVLDATQQYLAEGTDVDPDGVVQDIENDVPRDAVETNLQTAQSADVGGTPTFFLFNEGTYRTRITGPQSFEVFENSLGV